MTDSSQLRRSTRDVSAGVRTVPVTVHWIWAPAGLLSIIAVPAVVWTLLLPSDAFPILFGQPAFLDDDLRRAAVVNLVVCYVACLLGVRSSLRSRASIELNAAQARWLDQAVRGLAAVTFCAYAIWMALAVSRGLRFDAVVSLISGTRGSMYVLRNNYFESVGGLTTWMQLGAVMVPLAVLRSKAGLRRARTVVVPVLLLALARALLNSERLALIEIVGSGLLATLMLRPALPRVLRGPWGGLRTILGSWCVLFVSFGFFEFFRSWTTVRATQGGSFWSYTQNLLFGYYATALNNAAFDEYLLGERRLPSALFDGDIYDSLLGPSPIAGAAKVYGLEIYTNRSGVLTPYVAFGPIGGVVLLAVVGFVMAALFRRAAAGGPVAFAIYCASSVGLLEIARIFYFGSSRFLPVVIAFVALALWHRVVSTQGMLGQSRPRQSDHRSPLRGRLL